MSLPIYVDAYSGYKANERPLRFHLDEEVHEIALIEDRWQDPNAEYFKVRSTEGKRYLLRYDQSADQWTLQSGFDGDELLARPTIELIPVGVETIREAEARISGCEKCRGDEAHLPFDWILKDVLGKPGPVEFVISESAACPNCRAPISEKTLVEPVGGRNRSNWLKRRMVAGHLSVTSTRTTGNGFGYFAVVSDLSDAIDCRREIDLSPDCLEIRFEMLCRYVVGKIPDRTDDVLLHADGDMRLHGAGPSRSRLNIRQQLSKTHHRTSRIRLRRCLSALFTYLPVTSSNRIPLLSP
jgi:hypothetical protein